MEIVNQELEDEFRKIYEAEKKMLPYCVSGFVTCTELQMDVDHWLKYSDWKLKNWNVLHENSKS